MTGRQGRLWRVPSESWTPSRSRSAAALSLIRSSGLSRSGIIPSGAGLPKPRHRRGRKSHIPREKSQTGNGHNCFQSRSPWTAPLKEGATIHHLKVVCCALPGASCGKRMIARSVPAPVNHHRGSYTSPALADASYPFVYLPPGNTLHCKLFPSSKFYNRPLYFSETMRYNEVNDKLEFGGDIAI